MKRTYVGRIRNAHCDIQILVLAEDMSAARARVLDRCGHMLGVTCREEDLQVIAFAQAV